METEHVERSQHTELTATAHETAPFKWEMLTIRFLEGVAQPCFQNISTLRKTPSCRGFWHTKAICSTEMSQHAP